jgi:hypothetical protein
MSCNRDANEASCNATESTAPEQAHNLVAHIAEADTFFRGLHADFQSSNGSSGSVAHIDKIKVED